MNHVVVPAPVRLSEVHGLVTAAARCWRTARDQRARVQRRLYRLLVDQDCGMLAPVFNGLLTLYEAVLGRPIVVGETRLSPDELTLLRIVDGSHDPRGAMRCSENMATAFSCAVWSARIMMAKVFADRIGPYRPSGVPSSRLDLAGGERLFDWKGTGARTEQPFQWSPA